MNPDIPRPAALLLRYISDTETGNPPPRCYETIYSHKQGILPRPLTQMTLRELQAGQKNRWGRRVDSSASGAYQFMYATLRDLIKRKKLNLSLKFTPDLQDWLGFELLKRRGYFDFMAGRISLNRFALNLAQEWASFPVLESTPRKGKRNAERGESYYVGDGINSSLTKASNIEALLKNIKASGNEEVAKVEAEKQVIVEKAEEVAVDLDKTGTSKTNWWTGIGAVGGFGGTIVSAVGNFHPVVQGIAVGGFLIMTSVAAVMIWRERQKKTNLGRGLGRVVR